METKSGEIRLGPGGERMEELEWSHEESIDYLIKSLTKKEIMHYRNGREAKNGDTIVEIGSEGKIVKLGVLHNATPGNDYCNGSIAPISTAVAGACICDCLHLDDLAALLKEKGFDKRSPGK